MDSREGIARADTARLVSRTVRLPDASLTGVLRTLGRPNAVWTAPDEPGVVGYGAAAQVTADGAERFGAVRERADDVLASPDRPADAPAVARPRFLGGFAFHDGHAGTGPWDGFPTAAFVLPHVQVVTGAGETWLTVNAHGENASESAVERTLRDVTERFAPDERAAASPPGVVATERTTSRAEWREQVRAATGRIRSGELEKVVLAQALDVTLGGAFSLPDAMARLGDTYPSCFRFALRPTDGAAFFGASPERLVTRDGDALRTGALAATVGRGGTPDEDQQLAADLRSSSKYRHEHEVVAERIRDQLDDVATAVETGERRVRKLETVQHLFTPITASSDAHVLTLVEALHPTPAVGGLPPDAALRVIRETETFDRGWYAAPVGWFDRSGDGTFAVALRSALADETRVRPFAGAGIVADSDPDTEWDEVQLKYRPILDVFEDDGDDGTDARSGGGDA
ncbi:menaquinone-specific isochorismate synthase [Halarchaeum solikamskense]|uniref:isochorismate synthase n=1 Tax=Halarchaeum nitratireducens TaxID=489913 RepID=UPI001B3B0974|nr:isochorismate synthase [Halarchaeum solikamskense]MBP2250916.1 menaquinone-specific isochorismate synthase [Halarchaeum solikamskense]